ncbi:MAG TPA: hypothetical protein VL197_04910 [Nitrospirota bacterium]|nr:hypothetical protein [Nitrospirota bacterium]
MNISSGCSAVRRLVLAFFWVALASGTAGTDSNAAELQLTVNGIYLLAPPTDYKVFEERVIVYRKAGADTLIIRPVTDRGGVNRQLLAKAVFFAHHAGMRLFVVLPTRSMSALIEQHPDWEDMYYDPRSGTVEPSGTLDLFNPYVTVYLSDLFRDIAGYSVDGIILDEDFSYSDTEGMSDLALDRYRKKYGSSLSVRSAFGMLPGIRDQKTHSLELYGEGFWNLAEMKKNALLVLLRNIMQASRAVNKQVTFGIALHVPGLFLKDRELLAWYGHDLETLKKMDINYYWLAIPHREDRTQQDSTDKMAIETASRTVISWLALVNEPGRIIIAIQTFSSSGKILPLSEIEEVAMQVKKTGNPGLAFMVEQETELPPELTRKIFRYHPE